MDALLTLLRVVGLELRELAEAEEVRKDAEAAMRRTGPYPRAEESLAFISAILADLAGDHGTAKERALRALGLARRLERPEGDKCSAVYALLGTLAMSTHHPHEAMEPLQKALELMGRILGERNPQTLSRPRT